MATKNDITGDALISKTSTDAYRNNYDLIFGKKKREQLPEQEAAGDSEEVSMSELRESKRNGCSGA